MGGRAKGKAKGKAKAKGKGGGESEKKRAKTGKGREGGRKADGVGPATEGAAETGGQGDGRPGKLEREAGTEDRQGGTQVPTRELLWRGAGLERGTQIYAQAAPEPPPRTLPPLDEQWKALKVLGHLLAALKSQQEGRSSKAQSIKAQPKAIVDTMEVLGSVGELFLPAWAFHALTSDQPPPAMRKEPSKRFLEALEKLPWKAPKKDVEEAVGEGRLMRLSQLGAFLAAYSAHMEVTDRAVKSLLAFLVKDAVMDPKDLDDYHLLITLHLKDRKQNRPITIAKGLAEFHGEVSAEGVLGLKRRSPLAAVLPPHPRSLNLRVLGSLLCQLAEVAEAGTAAGKPGADLSAAAARDLAESQLSIQRARPLSSALVSLAIVARYMARDPDFPVQLRQVGSGITRRLSGGNFGPWPLEDLAKAFFLLSARLRLPSPQWAELMGKLKGLGWLSEDKAALLLKVFDGEKVGAMEVLGWVLDLVEGEGEWWEVGRRTELAPQSVLGEPVRWGRLGELAEGERGAALGLLVEYVGVLKVEGGQRGRDGREEGLEEKAARCLALQRLKPLLSLLGQKDKAKAAKATILVSQGGDSSQKLATLFDLLFPSLRLTREQLLPALLRLKAQRRLTLAQFTSLLSKTPYPVPFPVLKTILDKVLAWTDPTKA